MLSREKLKTERNFDFVTQSKKQRHERKDIMTGIIRILILFIVGSIFLAIAGYILSFVIDIIGRIIVFVLQWAVFGGIAWYGYKYFKKPKPKEKPAEVIPEEAIYIFRTADCYRKPFQGYFCFGCCRIWKF